MSISHLDCVGCSIDIVSYKDGDKSITKSTIWNCDGTVELKIMTTYPDGHEEVEVKHLVERCGIAVDPDISDEEFEKLKKSLRCTTDDSSLNEEDTKEK